MGRASAIGVHGAGPREPGAPSSEATPGREADGPAPDIREHAEDLEHLERVAKGDERSFRFLVERYQDRIFGFCARMLSDPSEAEDVAQDVFLTLYRHAAGFRGESRVSTWLYRIAKNQTLNRLKYLDRRGRGVRTSLHVVRDDALVDARPRPDDQHEARETWRRVRVELEQLEDDYRMVVVLRDLDGLSYEEIAQITGLPKGTVKSRIHRGRQALASRLEGLDQ